MTVNQKTFLLDAYNQAADEESLALDKVDYYEEKARMAQDEKSMNRAKAKAQRFDMTSSYQIGVMSGIHQALDILGYTLVIRDDRAVDIEEN